MTNIFIFLQKRFNIKYLYKEMGNFIKKHPMITFLVSMIVLLVIIFIGNKMRAVDKVEDSETNLTKKVSVIKINDQQKINLSGQVEKDGVVTIFSQIAGVVNNVYVEEGEKIGKGKSVIYIADNYSGSNSASVAYQIAERQVQNQDETFEKQMKVIDDQRDDVKKTNDTDSKITRRQYTIQKRNTEMQYDLAVLQKQQATINSLYHTPTAPFTGTVERVFVSKGDMIGAGTKIAVINSDDKKLSVAVNINSALASVIDVEKLSVLAIGDEQVETLPTYLSKSETDNQSYVVIFDLDEKYLDKVVNNEFVDVAIPITTQMSEEEILLPIDVVRVMSNKSVVFVAEDGVAKSREVITGDVMGNFIVVKGGISENDSVILDRNVFDGDGVEVE